VENSYIPHQADVRRGSYLPHWTLEGATYSVVFRLADSLPQTVIVACEREIDTLHAALSAIGASALSAEELRRERFSAAVARALDAGHGACWMRQPKIASLVADALRFFEGKRYDLAAWCVMPNHVHVVVRPLAPHSLSAILQAWKGYTARVANQFLARRGTFWQQESYDHLIRDKVEFAHSIRYVLENPLKAGLQEWPWVWASAEARLAAGIDD
jgi:REP element-mobilizing transposase RayT